MSIRMKNFHIIISQITDYASPNIMKTESRSRFVIAWMWGMFDGEERKGVYYNKS